MNKIKIKISEIIGSIGCIIITIIAILPEVLMVWVPVYALWNWLCPSIFGLPKVTFMQALGLIALIKLLFFGLTDINKENK